MGGQNTDLEYDYLVVSEDPGYIKKCNLANTNRLLTGRNQGLKYCKRKYTLVIRSDSEIINLNFLEAFEKQPKKDKNTKYSNLKSRIVICSAGNLKNSLFFLCDWYFFGLTEDVKKMYAIEPFDEANGKLDLSRPEFQTPHEFLGIGFSRGITSLDYEYKQFHDSTYRALWEHILVDNFIPVGFYKRYGIVNLKEPYYSNQKKNEGVHGIVHLMMNLEKEDWNCLYRKYYHDRISERVRVRWLISRCLISLYRVIKPMHSRKGR